MELLGWALLGIGMVLLAVAKFVVARMVESSGEKMREYEDIQRKRRDMPRPIWDAMYDRIAAEDENGMRESKKGMVISVIQLMLICVGLACILSGAYLINE